MAAFDIPGFLTRAGLAPTINAYRSGATIFRQGDRCEDVQYIESGAVTQTVTSKDGRERVVALLRAADFFGEGSLAGQPVRTSTAVAIMPSAILRLDKQTMIRLLHEQPPMADHFIAHMLARNIRI
jgi:CRP-like cAMP-binding protein